MGIEALVAPDQKQCLCKCSHDCFEWEWKKRYYRAKRKRDDHLRFGMPRVIESLRKTASPLENKVVKLEAQVKRLESIRPRVIYTQAPKPDRYSEKEGYL